MTANQSPAGPNAWGSPDTTIRSNKLLAVDQGMGSTGKWSEGVQPFNSNPGSAMGDEIQVMYMFSAGCDGTQQDVVAMILWKLNRGACAHSSHVMWCLCCAHA